MEHLSQTTLLFVFTVTFVGQVYSAIFGGGSFLVQPALIALGIPPHFVIANDIMASVSGDVGSAYVFFKKKHKIDWNLFKYWLPGILLGPFLGIAALKAISPEILRLLIPIFCVVGALITLFDYKKSKHTKRPKHWQIYAVLCGFALAFHVAFSSAGTSTYCQILLMWLFGFNIRETMAMRNFILAPAGLLSVLNYSSSGLIVLRLVIPMVMAALLGGYAGTHLAHRVDEKKLKLVFLIAVFVISGVLFIYR